MRFQDNSADDQPPPDQGAGEDEPETEDDVTGADDDSAWAGFMRWLSDSETRWLRYLAIALIVIAVVVAFIYYRHEIAAGFKRFLAAIQSWWAGLFGRKLKITPAVAAAMAADKPPDPPKPFDWFSNPFDNPDEFDSPEEMVRYTFDALQSWAHEQSLGRKQDETALEFAERLGTKRGALDKSFRRLADIYSRVAYARGRVTPSALDWLRQFWQELPPPRPRSMAAAVR
jgi:hypothetical protein